MTPTPTDTPTIRQRLRAALGAAWGWVRRWLAPVPGAVRDRLCARELVRVLVTAVLAGGGLGPILVTLASNVHLIAPGIDPGWSTTLVALLTAAAEALRRLHQGEHDTPHEGG